MARAVGGNRRMWTRVRCAVVFCIMLPVLDYAGSGITSWAGAGGQGRAADHLARLWTAAADAACAMTARAAATVCDVAWGGFASREAATDGGTRHYIVAEGTGSAFSISGRCTGAAQMLAVIAAVMCLPGNAGRKSLAALAGAAATGVMNVARIAVIAATTHDDAGSFGFVHDVAVGVPFSIAVFAVMVACAETYMNREMEKGEEKV